jgi:hypothetical protein
MRSVDNVTADFLANAPRNGIIQRDLVSIVGKHRSTGAERMFCFWSGLDTYAINVVSGETGAVVSRDFVGDGSIIRVGKTTRRSGLEYKNKTITLSMAHPEVELMVRGYDLRMAPIEFHVGILDPASHLFAANPVVDYMGFINEPNDVRPAPGSEGGVTLSCLSHSVELTNINPLRRAHVVQNQRSGDGLYKYLSIISEVNVTWGQ